ncbi:MAG: FtsX-like permease family protein [Acidimicrobiales bacterium]|nr:FtsX-like permease family protein [Acidimicrobiales bacterium]
MIDSFLTTLDRADAEVLGNAPDRLFVRLDGFQLAGSSVLSDLSRIEGVARVEPGLRLGGTVMPGPGEKVKEFEVMIDFIDLNSSVWRPSIVHGRRPGNDSGGATAPNGRAAGVSGDPSGDAEPELLVSHKAADDLSVGPGDRIRIRHPNRDGVGYRWVESDVRVAGIHPNPYRFVVFMDLDQAMLVNAEGIYNFVQVQPEAGTDATTIQRALFHQPGVASVQPIASVTRNIRQRIYEFLDVLDVIKGVVLLLAVLIAFNSSSIAVDERAREHATMFAFGVPTRTVVGMAIAESACVGLAATATGVSVGLVLLHWIVSVLLPDTMPDLFVAVGVHHQTYLTAGLVGVVGVALAPLLTLRKLRHMPVPETLRVVE